MKRIFSILFLLALLSSCSKVDLPLKEYRCISVAIPGINDTKAAADGDGSGRHVDRCRLQVWLPDSLCYDHTVAVEDMHARFYILLNENPDYVFLFWADNAGGSYYDTDTLTRVRFRKEYSGNDDARDAFCRRMTSEEVKSVGEGWIILKRPFGQVNVITDDIDDLFARSSSETEYFLPNTAKVSFSAPSEYDVSTGKVSSVREFSYSVPVYSMIPDAPENTIVMDYILASEEKSVFDMKLTLMDPIDAIDYDLANLPLQRNWRTNVRGSLLTGKVKADVRIDSQWMGEIESGLPESL